MGFCGELSEMSGFFPSKSGDFCVQFRKEAIFLNGFSDMRLESGNFNVNSIKGEVFEVGFS